MKKNLLKDLKIAGADNHEARDLADFVENLKVIRPRGLSADKKAEILRSITDEPADKTYWFTRVPLAGSLVAACLIAILSISLLPGWLNGGNVQDELPIKTLLEHGAEDELPEQTSPTEEILLEQKQEIEPPKIEAHPPAESEDDMNTNTEDSQPRNNRWWRNPYSNYRWQGYLRNSTQKAQEDDKTKKPESENDTYRQFRINRWR